jgi:pyruvate dehydrogenase E2 component (dihydrolipoamide acetyltransferase)
VYTDVVLPNLGFGMEEGRLIAWRKHPGDPVRKGDVLAEVESDKATVELEAVADGVLADVLVQADTVVSVGAVLARIDTAPQREAAPAAPMPAVSAAAPSNGGSLGSQHRVTPLAKRIADVHGVDLNVVTGTGVGGRISSRDVQDVLTTAPTPVYAPTARPLAAPAVRKLARDRGLDLRTVVGTGSLGQITRQDVEAALNQAALSPAPLAPPPAPTAPIAATPIPTPTPVEGRTEVSLSRMRQVIAARLVQSMQQSPHYYVTAELDFTPALRHLPVDIGINALLMHLTIKALRDVPAMNATYEDGHLYHYSAVNLALAVALPDGLITPVLHRADDYSLRGLADRARDLVGRARDSRLRPDELSGGTFTLSNLGIVQQVDRFTAIINPPQVAILAIGAVKKRPFVIDDGLYVRTTAHLTVSSDHRFIDGKTAARFVEAFDSHLQAFSGS